MPEKDNQTHSRLMERRSLFLIVVLVFVILSAMAFFTCYRHHTINTEQTLKEDRSTASLLSQVLDEHLKKIVGVMKSYSNRPSQLRAVRDKNVENASQRLISLSDLIKQVFIEHGAFITATDRKGQIVYSTRYDVEQKARFYPFHPDMKNAIAANKQTFAVDDPEFGGRRRHISFSPIASIGWTVFVGRDERSILLSESAYYFQVTAISFLLFLSIFIFLFYSRKQVMSQQILERLRAEKELQTSETRFHLAKLSLFLMMSPSANGRRRHCSDRWRNCASNDELEHFDRAAIGREVRMIELKQEINALCRRPGELPRYGTDPFEPDRLPGAGQAQDKPGGGGS